MIIDDYLLYLQEYSDEAYQKANQKAANSMFGLAQGGVGGVANVVAKKSIKGLPAAAALSGLTWGGYRAVRAAFDKCTRACGVFKLNTPPRQLCMAKCKLQQAVKMKDGEKVRKWYMEVKELERVVKKLKR